MRNLGVEWATTQYVFLSDADVVPMLPMTTRLGHILAQRPLDNKEVSHLEHSKYYEVE